MTPRPLHCLLVGSLDRREFAAVQRLLTRNDLAVRAAADLRRLLAEPAELAAEPDLVLLCQSHGGQYRDADVAALRQRWPLAGWGSVVLEVGSG